MKKTLIFLFFALLISGSLYAQYKSYRITQDESLEELAERFDVSKSAILKMNPDLKEGDIAGKIIVIPPAETDNKTPKAHTVRFKEYKVAPKETLWSIAQQNGIEVEDLKRYNPYLYEEELGAGDMIQVPIFQDGKINFNASVQTSTFKNLIHVVMPGETKYGIAKLYEMSVEELDSLNPFVGELHPGQVLKVINPLAEKTKEGDFAYYEVKPKETFYSLTRRFHISRDSLVELNPVLKELGLQAGMSLKLPNAAKAYFKKEEVPSNVSLSGQLTNLSTKNIVIMLPFNLPQFKGASLYKKENLLKNDAISQISLDIYSGIKAAIDSAQSLGIPIRAKVFDTQASEANVRNIMSRHSFEDARFVIGPLLPKMIKEVTHRLQDEKVFVFSPLTNQELSGGELMVQTRPSKLAKEKVLVTYLDQHREGKNFLILSDQKHAFFVEKLRAYFPKARMITRSKDDYLTRSDVKSLLVEGQPNWVILETDNYADINNVISYLNLLRSAYDIRVFTTDKNKIYDEKVPAEYLSHLHFTYTSTDKSDMRQDGNSFITSYKEKYGYVPNKYAIRGFDVTFDALLRSASAETLKKAFEQQKGATEYVANRFYYHKKMIGGYYNSAVYLIKFKEGLELEIIN